MHGLTAEEILRLCDRAEALSPVDRAVLLAAATGDPPASLDDAARLPIGRRDALLLRLRSATVGEELTGWAPCPGCGTPAEFVTGCTALLAVGAGAVEPAPVTVDGHLVRWRLPDSRDAAAVAGCADPDEAGRRLLNRCLLDEPAAAGPDGHVDAVRAAVAAAMAKADPLADLVIAMACPQCSTTWESPLDIAEFLWAELRARATHLLADVDTLARAYGWREPDILALSEARRAAYLRMVRGG